MTIGPDKQKKGKGGATLPEPESPLPLADRDASRANDLELALAKALLYVAGPAGGSHTSSSGHQRFSLPVCPAVHSCL